MVQLPHHPQGRVWETLSHYPCTLVYLVVWTAIIAALATRW